MTGISEKEFRSRVLAHAEGLKASSLNFAINLCVTRNGMLREGHIDICVEAAREFERYYQQRLQEDGLQSQLELVPQPRPRHGSPPVGELITSDLIVEWLQPRIGEIRQALFSDSAPPFSTYEAAVDWLVRLGTDQWHRWQQRYKQKEEEWRKKTGRRGGIVILSVDPSEIALEKASNQAKAIFHLSYKRRCIPYETARDDLIPTWHNALFQSLQKRFPDMFAAGVPRRWSIEIYEDSILAKLEQASHEIAEAIGVDKGNVIAWILADKKPTIPSIRMHQQYKELKLSDKATLKNRTVVIEILEPEHLAYDQLKDIYHYIREDFNVTRVKALTVAHQRLLDIVKRLGGIPAKHGTKSAFWEQVRHAWNREVGREEYSEWRPLERKYKRLIKKLRLRDQESRNRK
jgi:hypothetical protein